MLADEKVSVDSVNTSNDKKDMQVEMHLSVSVAGLPTLSRAMARLEQLPNVTSVRRNA